MEETLDFLIPSYHELGANALNAAFRDVTDPDLRKALMADVDLQSEILTCVLDAHELGPGLKEPLGKARAHLDVIGSMPMPQLMLRLGCAAYSETLASVALKNYEAIEAAEIPRDVLKASLRFRKLSVVKATSSLPSRKELEADGSQTMACWLQTLPVKTALFVALRVDQMSPDNSARGSDKRKTLCEAVLAQLSHQGPGA